jgi:hypothetical protein
MLLFENFNSRTHFRCIIEIALFPQLDRSFTKNMFFQRRWVDNTPIGLNPPTETDVGTQKNISFEPAMKYLARGEISVTPGKPKSAKSSCDFIPIPTREKSKELSLLDSGLVVIPSLDTPSCKPYEVSLNPLLSTRSSKGVPNTVLYRNFTAFDSSSILKILH